MRPAAEPSPATEEPTGRLWPVMARLVASRWGLVLAFTWGFTEAMSWPIMAEMALVLFAVALPRRIWAWAAAIVAGSVAGVLSHAWLSTRDVVIPTPWTTPAMFETAHAHLLDGAGGIMHQALNGIPVKVYAQIAGDLGIDLIPLALWTTLERGARMGAAAVVLFLLSRLLHRLLRRWYGAYLVIAGGIYAGALVLVIGSWR